MSFFTKAQRHKAKLRLSIDGGPGSGKTYSALEIAKGIVSSMFPDLTPEAAMAKVFVIDSERKSAELYADKGDYQVGSLDVSFDPMEYVKRIHEAEAAGAAIIITDSLTHAWSGAGGALEQVDSKQTYGGNKFTAWREVTPKHNALVDAILQSPCHQIATMRTKVEYVLEKNDKGKMVPRKVGLKPVQREGMEYEFTVVMDINESHMAVASKDRTGILDGKTFQPTAQTGRDLYAWLNSGVEAPPPPPKVEPQHVQEPPTIPNGPVQTQSTPAPAQPPAFERLTTIRNMITNATDKPRCGQAWNAIIAAKDEGVIDAQTAEELKNDCKAKAATFTGV